MVMPIPSDGTTTNGCIWYYLDCTFCSRVCETIFADQLSTFFFLYILLWLKYLKETFLKKKNFVVGIFPIHILLVCEMGVDFAL